MTGCGLRMTAGVGIACPTCHPICPTPSSEGELKGVGLVILTLRRIKMSVLRFFAKEAQNDRVCGFVILNGVKDLALFTIKILRKRGSDLLLEVKGENK